MDIDIEFDEGKNQKNIAKHGISLVDAAGFDFLTAQTQIDNRKDYGEIRYVSIGYLGERLYVLCYVNSKNGVRVISLRKANLRERTKYEKTRIH